MNTELTPQQIDQYQRDGFLSYPGFASPLLFKPGGYHVMIMGVKNPPLKQGDTFPLTLTFEKAGDVTVTVMVAKQGGGMGHEHKGHGQMDHGTHKH